MQPRISIESEIGRLERVIIHSPGPEIEAMTPATAHRVLYNDIVPLSVVSREHDVLRRLLERFAEVHEVRDLLLDILRDPDVRAELAEEVIRREGIPQRSEELLALEPEELLRFLVEGLAERKDTLTSYLSTRIYDIPPLPNLYFMRDSGVIYRDMAIACSMRHQVRSREALFLKYLFGRHPHFRARRMLMDGTVEGAPGLTLEGGDFQVARKDLLVIGISPRTSTAAFDLIADRLAADLEEPVSLFAIVLPDERATIHLDMVFTFIDRDAALIYEPYISGIDRLPVVRMDLFPGGRRKLSRPDTLLAGLAEAGLPLEPVFCGGTDPLHQQREQWLSGSNAFAVRPGVIILYDCNAMTFEALDRAGFRVVSAEDVISGKVPIDGAGRIAIGTPGIELARGGGGLRCMTFPVLRSPLEES